jgi:protein arginine kinase
LTEEEIINHLSSVTVQVIEQERSARQMLYMEAKEQLEDRVWRAYGILAHARSISSGESMGLLSELRLGIDMKIIQEIDPRVFNSLMVSIQPSFLQQKSQAELESKERDIIRATIIREKILNGDGGV